MSESLTVGQLNGLIKDILEGTFPQLWVEAEISDISRPRSGHVYFTLKDTDSQIRGVMWRSTAQRVIDELGGSLPSEGDRLLCFGGVDVYPPRGSYQFNVRKIRPLGLGVLQQRFEALQKKLAAEGLFAAQRKRPLVAMPSRIAVITSPTSAAIRDFLQAATSRYRGVDIVVVPAIVQGDQAARSIVAAIKQAEQIGGVDALVITRGGGSIEDLWCFNEESVVRAIAQTSIPVISGVGHEIDVTLTDMVADVRALTPTDAASKVLPDQDNIVAAISETRHRLTTNLRGRIDLARSSVESLWQRPIFTRPHDLVRDRFRDLDDVEQSANAAVRRIMTSCRGELEKTAAATDALSPLRTLARGYSVTLGEDQQTITRASDVKSGDTITTRLSDGNLRSKVL